MGNNFIRKRWLNYEGRTVSGFRVYGVADSVTANRDGSPNWDCGCLTCHTRQVKTHTDVSGGVLYCLNAACSKSRVQHQADQSLREVRRAEREQRDRAEREQAERQVNAAKEAAREQAQRDYLESFRADHHRYAMQQIRQGTPVEHIMSLTRFASQGDEVRRRIMEAVARAGG